MLDTIIHKPENMATSSSTNKGKLNDDPAPSATGYDKIRRKSSDYLSSIIFSALLYFQRRGISLGVFVYASIPFNRDKWRESCDFGIVRRYGDRDWAGNIELFFWKIEGCEVFRSWKLRKKNEEYWHDSCCPVLDLIERKDRAASEAQIIYAIIVPRAWHTVNVGHRYGHNHTSGFARELWSAGATSGPHFGSASMLWTRVP